MREKLYGVSKILFLFDIKSYWLCNMLENVDFVLNNINKLIIKQFLDVGLAFLLKTVRSSYLKLYCLQKTILTIPKKLRIFNTKAMQKS